MCFWKNFFLRFFVFFRQPLVILLDFSFFLEEKLRWIEAHLLYRYCEIVIIINFEKKSKNYKSKIEMGKTLRMRVFISEKFSGTVAWKILHEKNLVTVIIVKMLFFFLQYCNKTAVTLFLNQYTAESWAESFLID